MLWRLQSDASRLQITGGSPSGAGSLQSGKGGVTGSNIAAGGTYAVTCQNAQSQVSGAVLIVSNFNNNDICKGSRHAHPEL